MKFSDNVKHISPSGTFEIFALMKEILRKGNDVIPLVAGELNYTTPPNIAQAGIEAVKNGHTGYTLNSGIPELREAICTKLKTENNQAYTPGQILVSCGSKHAIFNTIFALCGKGDEVIIFAPYYPSYPEIVKLAGATPVIIETTFEDDFEIDIKKLQKAVTDKTKLLILNSPNNPTGKVYGKETFETIGKLVLEHDFYIMSDEIYEQILYDNHIHFSPAEIVPELYERTIIINGFSKTYAMTGWRIGYAAGPEELIQKAAMVQSHMTSNASSIAQYAALEALKSGDEFIDAITPELTARRNEAISALEAIPKLEVSHPGGAFYLFCRYQTDKNLTSADVAKQLLLNYGVAVVPGTAFGLEDSFRISFTAGLKTVLEGIKRISTGLGKIL